MDVGDHIPELTVGGNGHAPKGMLEQASRSSIGSVDGFGVGIEEIGELLARVIFKP